MHILRSKIKTLLVPLIALTPIPFSFISCANTNPPFIPSPTAYVGNTTGTNWKGYKGGSLSLALGYYSTNEKWDGYGEAIIEDGIIENIKYEAENLIIPDFVQGEDGLLYKIVGIGEDYYLSDKNGFGDTELKGEVTLPQYLKNIGQGGFLDCNEITKIVTNNNLENIGMDAFSGCEKLFSETYGEKNKISHDENNIYYLVDENNIYYCLGKPQNLDIDAEVVIGSEITINEKTRIIARKAFMEKIETLDFESSDVTLKIGSNVEYIGSEAFSGCDYLTGDLVIPDKVKKLGDASFCNCTGFNGTLTIGKNVEEIGDSCFGLEELEGAGEPSTTFTSLKMESTKLKTLLANAFKSLNVFSSTFGEKNKISHDASNVYYLVDDNDEYYCLGKPQNVGKDESFTSDSITINGKTKLICGGAFKENNTIQTVIISDSVIYIGWVAFLGCTGLKSVTLGNNVEYIGSSAFSGCSELESSLSIPNSVISIDTEAFRECDSISALTIGNKVEYISPGAFYGCFGFTGSLSIPNSTKYIGDSAFNGCTGFNSTLTIGENVEYIGSSAFEECSGFTGSLSIPNNTKYIGNSAFYECTGFNSTLTIGNKVEYIDDSAFDSCSGFTGSLSIPDNTKHIGDYAFYCCTGFDQTLSIGNKVEYIDSSAFEGCSGFTGSLTIPDSTKRIGDYAFYYCTGFDQTLSIGNKVEHIGYYAFQGCSGFTGTLTIPNTVEEIEYSAFEECSGITKIDFVSWNELPTWTGNDIFAGFGETGTVVSTGGTMTSEQMLGYAKGKGLGTNWTIPLA